MRWIVYVDCYWPKTIVCCQFFAWCARLLTKNNVESSYKKDKDKTIKNCSRLINVLSYWLGSRCKCFGVLWCLWFLASMRATFNRVLLVCFVVGQVSKFGLTCLWGDGQCFWCSNHLNKFSFPGAQCTLNNVTCLSTNHQNRMSNAFALFSFIVLLIMLFAVLLSVLIGTGNWICPNSSRA